MLKLRDFFSNNIQFTKEPIKGTLHFHYSVFDLYLFFLIFLRISIFLLILSICSYMLSTFYIKIFDILVIVFFFNFWSNTSNILVISDSSSSACSAFMNCGVLF